ncbi:hypothetical protein HI914_06941 [Erysiphe necator]|uniref:Uncharacterized protein n=1 Tax=Uncinula necator TaxID=52586 RepID=A0A0B1PBL1_UNCNE|nr:hypothetical protein HI914_06941 [Erysiphe necator]KHJ34296.1 hypothetical protein EV44_g0396 [Erysiphe necator]
MPHYPALSGAVVVASLAFVTALAIYESPQARQFAEGVRRKVAIALYALGDEINPKPNEDQPRFNRPEDADGFLKSEASAVINDEADEDAKRRQREEILYWNAVKIAREEKERRLTEEYQIHDYHRDLENYGSRDEKSIVNDQRTSAYNSSTNLTRENECHMRNRGRKLSISEANSFNDKHHIRTDSNSIKDNSFIIPKYALSQDVMSDIYNATEAGDQESVEHNSEERYHELPMGNMPLAQDIYASIHAWAESAQSSSTPTSKDRSLSTSPMLTLRSQDHIDSESLSTNHEVNSHATVDGDLTPTDTGSLVCSTEETLWERQSIVPSDTQVMDAISLTREPSIAGTWSEIDSVISEQFSS